jgi:hypothetical protein
VRFILTAHLRRARTVLRRIRESEAVWTRLEKLTRDKNLPERPIEALYDAMYSMRDRNSVYRASTNLMEDGISEQMASRDLKMLANAGLLVPYGERRGRYYTAGGELVEMRNGVKLSGAPQDDSDPFASSAQPAIAIAPVED